MRRVKWEISNKRDELNYNVDRLFTEAFLKSEQYYNSITLCGWKPINKIYQNEEIDIWNWEPIDHPEIREETYIGNPETGIKIYETSESTIIELELPELIKESIRLDVREHTLTLSGNQYASKEKSGGEYSIRDDYFTTFHKYFTLPQTVRSGQVTAKFKTGGIKIFISKNQVQ